MRSRFNALFGLPLILAVAPGIAHAADYDPPIVIEDVDNYVPVEIGSGWYLRGDVGYSFRTRAEGVFDYRTYDPIAGTYGNALFTTGAIDSEFSYGIGAGYQFNEFLRGDVTLDAFSGRFDGTTFGATPCLDPVAFPAFAGTSCRSEDSATFTAYSVMANAYVDLGTYVGVTPYLGAGVGMTYVDWNDLTNTTFCVDGGGACPAPGALVATTPHPGLDSWRFTYAFMGGIAYDMSRNLKLDLGYKYSRVAGDRMFGFDAGTAGAGATGTQGRDPGFSRHEVRVGLRYSLW